MKKLAMVLLAVVVVLGACPLARAQEPLDVKSLTTLYTADSKKIAEERVLDLNELDKMIVLMLDEFASETTKTGDRNTGALAARERDRMLKHSRSGKSDVEFEWSPGVTNDVKLAEIRDQYKARFLEVSAEYAQRQDILEKRFAEVRDRISPPDTKP